MYIFVAPRRIVLKEKEVQDFRAVAERLVDESGIEAEFPLVTERSPLLKVLIWILGLFSALMLGGMGYLLFVSGRNVDDPLRHPWYYVFRMFGGAHLLAGGCPFCSPIIPS